MKYPQLIIFAYDDWLGKQLRELAADARWRFREVRQAGAVLTLLAEVRPTVVLVQADPQEERAISLELVSTIHQTHPHVALVVVCDAKLAEKDQAQWMAQAFDLGARYVVFPPLARPVLEDVVSGMMAATIARVVPRHGEGAREEAAVVDLADEPEDLR